MALTYFALIGRRRAVRADLLGPTSVARWVIGAVDVVEDGGGWFFSFEDAVVTEIRVGHRIVLVLSDARIGLEQPFLLHSEGRTTRVPPGDTVYDVADALPLLHQKILYARATAKAVLQITFEHGSVIEIGTDPSGQYEGWQVELSDDRVWVGIGDAVRQPRTNRAQPKLASPPPAD